VESKPSGFETFFARSADKFAKVGGPDMDKIVEIHREHGIELLEEDQGRQHDEKAALHPKRNMRALKK